MGSAFFLFLLITIFFAALFWIVLSTILIIVWHVKKRKGRPPKKRWLVVPVILLIVSVLVALIPVGYIGFLRQHNVANQPEVIYAESGKLLYWPVAEDEPVTNRFEMDGVKYVKLSENFDQEAFSFGYGEERLGEPIANIKYDSSYSGPFKALMFVLLSGSTPAEINVSTVYPVQSEHDIMLYYVQEPDGIFSADNTFCSEEKLDDVKAYYTDLSHYDMRNLICRYAVYADNEGKKEHAPSYINSEDVIAVAPGIFEQFLHLYEEGKGSEVVGIPEKYDEIRDAAIPGTSIYGYDIRNVFVYSGDRMAYRHLFLILLEDQVYAVDAVSSGSFSGYPLPADLNRYAIDNVFTR